MTRKKVKLAFITNDSARKATYKKRKKGMLKKVNELSTLCGIEACAVIYSPYDNQPEMWPTPLGVQRVLAQFKGMPEMEQSKKMDNQESFLKKKIAKANDQLKKLQRENREKEIQQVMYQCLIGKGLNHLNMGDLTDLRWVIDQTLRELNIRAEALKKGVHSSNSAMGSTNNNNNAAGVVQTYGSGFILNGHYEQKPYVGTMYNDHHPIPTGNNSVHDTIVQSRQWLVDLMNSNDQMGGNGPMGNGEEILPFGDISNNNVVNHVNINNGNNNIGGAGLWSNAFFPWEK